MIFVMDRKDSILRYQAGCIRVEADNKLIQRVAINQLAMVVVYGNPLAETSVWRNLADAKVPTVMLNVRGKNQSAMLGSGLATQLPLRIKQHQLAGDNDSGLRLAKWFIDKKISACHLPLRLLKQHYPVDSEIFDEHTQNSLASLHQQDSIAGLMGVEGQHAHAWFKLLAASLPAQWKFSGRNRRPPLDPVNALLSLSYTLLMAEIRQLVISFGFDPALGFLHQNSPGRDSLVLDVTEIFRSGVDYFVVQCLADQIFTPDDFYYRESTGCRLSKEARGKYYQAWAKHRHNWPRQQLNDKGEIHYDKLNEQITGQLMQLRERMQAGQQAF